MKTINSFYAVLTLVAASLLFTTSCSKESLDTVNESQFLISNNKIADDISVVDGMLAFQSAADYQGTVLALNKMTRTEIAAWEADLNFTAAFTNFVNIMKAEANHKGAGHSAIYQLNLDKNVIATKNGIYELNIFNPAYAVVLNDDFKVKVGNQIYQYTDSSVKIFTGNEVKEIMVTTTTVVERGRNLFSLEDDCFTIGKNEDKAMEVSLNYFSTNTEEKEKGSVIFIDMNLTVKALISDGSGDYEYATNPVTSGTYKYGAEMRAIDKEGKLVANVVEGDDEIAEEELALIYILTDASGNYESPDENGWDGAAKLNNFSIDVSSTITNNGRETLTCTVEL